MAKSKRKAHVRRTKSGKTSQVREHQVKAGKKKDAAKSKGELREAILSRLHHNRMGAVHHDELRRFLEIKGGDRKGAEALKEGLAALEAEGKIKAFTVFHNAPALSGGLRATKSYCLTPVNYESAYED